MINYRAQSGCHNCRNVFVREEYEDPNSFYCELNAPPRPVCGSILMNENFPESPINWETTTPEEASKLILKDPIRWAAGDAWDVWSLARQVHSWGICDSFEERPS